MSSKPVIFLTFANDPQGRFLEALRPEQEGISLQLADFQNTQEGIVHHAASSQADDLLASLNKFTGQLIIFHFSGHADGNQLQLGVENGQEILLHGAQLSDFLRGEAQANLKLVFLNACYTQDMLEAIQAIGVPAVIATETAIPDQQAKEFAIRFYRSWVSGNTLENAFIQAKSVLAKEDASTRVYTERALRAESTSKRPAWGLFVQNDEVLSWRISDLPQAEESPVVKESKNVLVGSTIQAGGDVVIGDRIETESQTSKRIRLLLFVLVPLLAMGGAYLWYQNQVLQQDFTLKVMLENRTPSRFLGDPTGTLSLTYGDKTEQQTWREGGVYFEGIPAQYKEEQVRLRYEGPGFDKIDSSFVLSAEQVLIGVKRDDTYARLSGMITEEDMRTPIPGVKVKLACCEGTTDSLGAFAFDIPAAFQDSAQRIDLTKTGYSTKSTTTPVLPGETFRDYLEKP
ncbi:MAG: CHAT domain-containing protein [Bacteroidota bacterium]